MDAPADVDRDRSEVRLVELIFPHQTNHIGTLFGGNALALMDKAAFLSATRYARRSMVTVASDRVEFKVPVRAGQLVELIARVTQVGRTSVTVGVEMYAEELLSPGRVLATHGSFVFVAIDERGHPVPVGDAAGPSERSR